MPWDGKSRHTPAGVTGHLSPSAAADTLIGQDPAELSRVGIFAQLSPEVYVLVNSTCGFGDFGVGERVERFCRGRALILPVARPQLGLHDAAVRGSGLLGRLRRADPGRQPGRRDLGGRPDAPLPLTGLRRSRRGCLRLHAG